MGGLDRYIDRHTGRNIGRCPIVTQPTIGRYLVEYRPIAHLMMLMVSVNVSTVMLSVVCRPTIGHISVKSRSIICRYMGRYIGRYSTDSRSSTDRGAGLAQWWERSPSTNVSRVRFPDPASYVDWVCWFSTLLREVFLRELRFSPLHKNQHLIWFIWFTVFRISTALVLG